MPPAPGTASVPLPQPLPPSGVPPVPPLPTTQRRIPSPAPPPTFGAPTSQTQGTSPLQGTSLQDHPRAEKLFKLPKPEAKMKTINWTKVPVNVLQRKCRK